MMVNKIYLSIIFSTSIFATSVLSCDGNDKEVGIILSFPSTPSNRVSNLDNIRISSPSPTPPATPTTYSELTTVLNSAYYTNNSNNAYNYTVSTSTVPLFVANLEAIENSGLDTIPPLPRSTILKKQLKFINSTWPNMSQNNYNSWNIWIAHSNMNSGMYLVDTERFAVIYKFLSNRSSTETTNNSWLSLIFGCCL